MLILAFMVGAIGLFGIGFFSEDRDIIHLHFLFSGLGFGGFAIGGFSTAILMLTTKNPFPKVLGIYLISIPPVCVIFLFIYITPIFEWASLFAILGGLEPASVILLRELSMNQKLAS
jgi:hypothetical protein